MPAELCPKCGEPLTDAGVQRAAAGKRLRAYLLRVFSADPTAHAVIEDGFRALLAPAGGGCTNELDAVLCAFREVVATYPEGLR